MHHLARLRRSQSKAAGHLVDAARLREHRLVSKTNGTRQQNQLRIACNMKGEG